MADASSDPISDLPHRLPWSILGAVGLQLGVLLVPPISVTPFGLAVAVPAPWFAEMVVLILLLGSLGLDRQPGQAVFAGSVTLLALGGLAYASWLATERLWVATLVLGLAAATVAYGLHRYERVSVGLVVSDST